MRENVLQTWSPAWLVLTALLMVGASTSGRYRMDIDDAQRTIESSTAAYCAAPAALGYASEIVTGRRAHPRAAAMLLVLAAQRGRFAGLAH